MNERAIKEEFGLVDESVESNEETVEETTENEVGVSPLMKEALEMGYKEKEDFVDAGGDPEKHVSPHEYVRYGKLQKSMREQMRRFEQKEKEFEQRFEHLNQMHKVQMDNKIKELKAQQRAAVEEADGDAFDRAQAEIDEIHSQNMQPVENKQEKHPAIQNWESDKDWINDDEDIRTLTAQGAWNAYVAKYPNNTVEQALEYVDMQLKKLSTPSNPLRDIPTATEKTSRRTSNKRGLSMSDLTSDEMGLWRNAGHSIWGGDEKAFLKSVEDARK